MINKDIINALTDFYKNFKPNLTGYRTQLMNITTDIDFYVKGLKPFICVNYIGTESIEWDLPDEQTERYENSLQDIFVYNETTKQFELK